MTSESGQKTCGMQEARNSDSEMKAIPENVFYQEHLRTQGGCDVELTTFWRLRGEGGEFLPRMENEMIFLVAFERSKIQVMAVFLNEASFGEGGQRLVS